MAGLQKHPFFLTTSPLGTFRAEERLRLSDRNSMIVPYSPAASLKISVESALLENKHEIWYPGSSHQYKDFQM